MKPDVSKLIALSDILAKYEEIKRGTKLPHGAHESDSHHAFSLTVIAYHICVQYDLGLNVEKVLGYAIVHDLLEIVTGDEKTLLSNESQLQEKHLREKKAYARFCELLEDYPELIELHDEYERLDTPEAATVFMLDKTCTIWPHFHDNGKNLYEMGIKSKSDIGAWYEALKNKLEKRLQVQPPQIIYAIFEESYKEMCEKLIK